jgi:hypothetical protein
VHGGSCRLVTGTAEFSSVPTRLLFRHPSLVPTHRDRSSSRLAGSTASLPSCAPSDLITVNRPLPGKSKRDITGGSGGEQQQCDTSYCLRSVGLIPRASEDPSAEHNPTFFHPYRSSRAPKADVEGREMCSGSSQQRHSASSLPRSLWANLCVVTTLVDAGRAAVSPAGVNYNAQGPLVIRDRSRC